MAADESRVTEKFEKQRGKASTLKLLSGVRTA